MVINWQIRELMRINCNIITIVKTIELLIWINKWNVCAYTFWSVLEINTSFRRHQRNLRRIWIGWMREHLFSSSSVSSPSFGFLGPSRPDLVMHRVDDGDWMLIGVDMWFLGRYG